ncbi:MAG TPA: PadR family transcriptional regulator [Chloroflexota bacterium]|nr:PadR family transcriptional regulator [Chloroflexota bacterium]
MSRASLPETTYAVLGLIDKVPGSSAYELTAVADRSFAYFWPVSPTLMYREVKRLTSLGWVTAEQVQQHHAPAKSILHITEEGRRALDEWLSAPATPTTTYRSGFLLKFFYAHRMRPDQVRTLLADYRSSLQAQRDELQAVMDKLHTMPGRELARLSALHGLRTAEAQLSWVDEVEIALTKKAP